MNNFPNAASLALLCERGVTHVVIDEAWFTDTRRDRLVTYSHELDRVYDDETTTIVRLAAQAACP